MSHAIRWMLVLGLAVGCSDAPDARVGTNTEPAKLLFPKESYGGDLAKTVAVGSLQAKAGVDAAGNFTYTLPLWSPPARGGVGPNLSLDYSSGAGNGLLGMGFSLGGLSSIHVCDFHEDELPNSLPPESPNGVVTKLCLDGMPLVRIAHNEYRTQNESFTRIVEVTEHHEGSLGHPPKDVHCGFLVYDRGGTIARYGCEKSALEHEDPQYANAWLGWQLSTVWDRHGNYWSVSYKTTKSGNSQHVVGPSEIRYTGNSATGDVPTRTITFEYNRDDAPRPDPILNSRRKWIKDTKLLRTIRIGAPAYNDKVWEYRLNYLTDESDGSTNRSKLSSIKFCAKQGTTSKCLPPTVFEWQIGEAGFRPPALTSAPNWLDASECGPPRVADFDGDGRDDVLSPINACNSGAIYRGAPEGLTGSDTLSVSAHPEFKPLFIDADGDAGTDLLFVGADQASFLLARKFVPGTGYAWPPSGFTEQLSIPAAGDKILQATVVELDDDGAPDLLACEQVDEDCSEYPCTPIAHWYWYKSNRDGTFAPPQEAESGYDAVDCYSGAIALQDRNGDGRFVVATENTVWSDEYTEVKGGYLHVRNGQLFALADSDASAAGMGFALDAWGDGRWDFLGQEPPESFPPTPDIPTDTEYVTVRRWDDVQSHYVAPGALQLMMALDYDGNGTDDLLWRQLDDATAGDGPGDTALGMWKVTQFIAGEPQPALDTTIAAYGVLPGSDGVCGANCLTNAQPTLVGDFDGDGQADFAVADPGWANGDSVPWTIHRRRQSSYKGMPAKGAPDLLRRVRDGFNADVDVDYRTMTDPLVYEQSELCAAPSRCVRSTRSLVWSMKGVENIFTTYKYRDARVDGRTGRTLGFTEVESHIETFEAAITRRTYYDTVSQTHDSQAPNYVGNAAVTTFAGYPFVGEVIAENVTIHDKASDRWYVDSTQREVELRGTGIESYHVVPKVIRQRYWDLGVGVQPTPQTLATAPLRTIETRFEKIDEYGFAIEVVREISGKSGAKDRVTEVSEYQRDLSRWAFARKSHSIENLTAGGKSAKRATTFVNELQTCPNCVTVDGEPVEIGRFALKSTVVGSTPDTLRAITLGYDVYGNVTAVEDAIQNAPIRKTSVDMDPEEHAFAFKRTNALDHVDFTFWDPVLGLPRGTASAFGTSQVTDYDQFGRVLERRAYSKDGTQSAAEVQFSYARAWPGGLEDPSPLRAEVTTAGGGWSRMDHDERGRPVHASWSATTGITHQRQAYDTFGRVRRISLAVSDSEEVRGGQYIAYDALDRVILQGEIDPNFAWPGTPQPSDVDAVVTAYDGLTRTVVDAEGKTFTQIQNVLGQPVRTIDGKGGASCFVYAPFGNLERIQRGCEDGNVDSESVYVHDDYGRMTSISEPDGTGSRVYKYNGYGELLESLNGAAQLRTFHYDLLGRLTESSGPDGKRRWFYDYATGSLAAPGGTEDAPGLLVKTQSPDGHEQHLHYDSFARPAVEVSRFQNEAFRFEQSYDVYGRPNETVYPKANGAYFAVKRQYDTVGGLWRVVHIPTLKTLWEAKERDPQGRHRLEAFGNGLTTKTDYDAKNGDIQGIRTGVYAGNVFSSTVQNVLYTYYKNGNLKDRIIYDGQMETDHYDYDEINRLFKTSTYVGDSGIGAVSNTLTYDAFGNIEKHPKVGTIKSTPSGRVISVNGTATHKYNGAGQLYQTPDEELQYNDLEKLSAIITASGATKFAYDADGTRVKRTAPDGTVTIYVGPYQRVGDEHRYSVSAEGRVVTVGIQTGNDPKKVDWRYIHSDRQGSAQVITNSTKAVVEKQPYDAWGEPRISPFDPTFAVQTPAGANAFQSVDVGYTGHSATLDGPYINMRGRTYDPRIARFTSSDPIVQEPFDTQKNGYSYVRNNPTTFTDPSGYWSDGECTWCGSLGKVPGLGIAAAIGSLIADLVSRNNTAQAPDCMYSNGTECLETTRPKTSGETVGDKHSKRTEKPKVQRRNATATTALVVNSVPALAYRDPQTGLPRIGALVSAIEQGGNPEASTSEEYTARDLFNDTFDFYAEELSAGGVWSNLARPAGIYADVFSGEYEAAAREYGSLVVDELVGYATGKIGGKIAGKIVGRVVNSRAARILKLNGRRGKQWERVLELFAKNSYKTVARQVHVVTNGPLRKHLILDLVIIDGGRMFIVEAKYTSRKWLPWIPSMEALESLLRNNQKYGFRELQNYGATVVSEGKMIPLEIPAGTPMHIIPFVE